MSRFCPKRKKGNRSGSDAGSVASSGPNGSSGPSCTGSLSSAGSAGSRNKGGRRKPRRNKISDNAIPNVAVCETVSEEVEAIADSIYASVDNGCASLERTYDHTDKKRAP